MQTKQGVTRIKAAKGGFTLIEVIAVLVILGVLAAVAIPKYIDLQGEAEDRAIDAGISELNGRENLVWAQTKLSSGGYNTDADLFTNDMDTDLGGDYTWSNGPAAGGGTLDFGSASAVLNRAASDTDKPAVWTRQ